MAETIAYALATAIEGAFYEGAWMFTAGEIGALATGLEVVGALTAANYAKRQASARARAAYNASLRDREILIRSAVAPRVKVYGQDRISGVLADAFTTGTFDEVLHLVIAFADANGTGCEGVQEVWFGDTKLPALDSNGDVTSGPYTEALDVNIIESLTSVAVTGDTVTLSAVPDKIVGITLVDGPAAGLQATGWAWTAGTNVISGLTPYIGQSILIEAGRQQLVPCVRIKFHNGAPGQTADADLVAASAGRWTAAHKGENLCYGYFRLRYVQDVFQTFDISTIKVVLKGHKVLDYRTGVVGWTDNAALLTADWLRDQQDGLRAKATHLVTSEMQAEASLCDEAVTLATGTQKRYTYNSAVGCDQSPRDVLAQMLTASAGTAVWVQGRWLLRVGAYRTPSFTITDGDLAGGGPQISPVAAKGERFNAVRVTYRDPDQGWAEVQAPLVTNATYEAEDGDVRVVRQIELPFVADAWRAQRLGKIELERHRQATTCTLTTNMRVYDTAPTDVGLVDIARYGWSGGKAFEVKSRTFTRDLVLSYTLRETDPSVWEWAHGEATAVDPAPATSLPNPFRKPSAVQGLAVASGTAHLLVRADGTVDARALVSWTPSADVYVTQGGRVELRWKLPGSEDWQPAPPAQGSDSQAYVAGIPEGRAVYVAARLVNSEGVPGPLVSELHVMQGKSQAPSNVAGFSVVQIPTGLRFTWDAVADLDLQEYVVIEAATWSDATPALWRGRANTFELSWPAAGSHTYLIKALDSSGNYSASAGSGTVVVGDGAAIGTAQIAPGAATEVRLQTVAGPISFSTVA